MGSPIKRHLSREKSSPQARRSVFFLGEDADARMGVSIARRSSRHLIDSFAPSPIYSQRFTEVSVFPLLKDHLYRVIHLFPIAVVSLGLSVSVLTAPVTHQDQGLQ